MNVESFFSPFSFLRFNVTGGGLPLELQGYIAVVMHQVTSSLYFTSSCYVTNRDTEREKYQAVEVT